MSTNTNTPSHPIDEIATHEDLVGEIGSEVDLRRLMPCDPPDEDDPSRAFRERAYQDVLKLLARRTPPICEGDLSSPSQLRDAVVYGTLARLYRQSATTEDDIHATQWKHWKTQLQQEVTYLRVDVDNHASIDVISIPVGRR